MHAVTERSLDLYWLRRLLSIPVHVVRFEDSGWANFVEGVGGDTTLKDTEGRLEVPGVELVGSIDDALGFVFQNDYSFFITSFTSYNSVYHF